MTSYAEAVRRLHALGHELALAPGAKPRKFDLAHMRALVAALGHPERRFPCVLVAGTNGKGSTSATLASILASSGLRTGLYTSPHLVRPNERIQVFPPHGDGEPIDDPSFAALFDRVEDASRRLLADGRLDQHPSFFEMLTAMAFLHFSATPVDIAVLEVGMGGRLDATNVVDPLLSVVTDISLDHQQWLGDTVAAIAREKAGILRPGGVMVTLPQHPEANRVLGEVATALGVRGVNAARFLPVTVPPGAARAPAAADPLRPPHQVEILGETVALEPALPGRHQERNTALAAAAALELRSLASSGTIECFNQSFDSITPESIVRGVRRTRWPGRLQLVPVSGRAPLLLDVAHNPDGAWALRAALRDLFDDRPRTLVFGCMRDKALRELAQILFPVADRVVATQADSPRAASPEEIREAGAATGTDILCEPQLDRALELAWELTPPTGLVVVSGSVYLVGAILAQIGSHPPVDTVENTR